MGARPAREDGERWVIYCTSGFLGLLLVFAGYSIYLLVTEPPPPWYSVTVGAVSGLDPAMVDPRGALDPAFNLTLRIDATLSAKDKGPYCLERATSVEVSYLGVPLAVGRAPEPGEGTCADAGQQRDLAVVARARGVVVPGFLLDSLADDVRRGEAVFEVTLMTPRVGEGDSDGDWKEMTCWGKVGDDASLETPCVKSSVDAGLPRRCPGLPAASPVRCSGRRSTSR